MEGEVAKVTMNAVDTSIVENIFSCTVHLHIITIIPRTAIAIAVTDAIDGTAIDFISLS